MRYRGPGFHMRRPPGTRVCAICSGTFRPIAANQKICSKRACKREIQRQAHERFARRQAARPALPDVLAQAAVALPDGRQRIFTARLWRRLPRWWNLAGEEDRTAWLEKYFRARLRLDPGARIVRVTVVA